MTSFKDAAILDLRACSVVAKRLGSLLLTLFQQVILIHKLLFLFLKNQFGKKEQAIIRFLIIEFAKRASFKIRHHDVFMSFEFFKARF